MMIIKVGGSKGINYNTFLEDFASLCNNGERMVLIVGASSELNDVSTRLGKPPRMVTSVSGYESRHTDRETLEIFEMVYSGKYGSMVVEKLQSLGINAVHLNGIDGRLLLGKRKDTLRIVENGKKKVLRNDFTGRIEEINIELLNLLLNNGYQPVITAPGLSYENEAINFDNDRVAALLASRMEADHLLIFSNTPGLLRDPNDESTLVKSIDRNEISSYMDFAEGRMRKKMLGVMEAIDGGHCRITLADARAENPISMALAGNGTIIE